MRSIRYKKAAEDIDKNATYPIDEAIKLAKAASNEKFDAALELHLRLGIDPSKGDQQVRGTISLPHGTGGKTKRVAAFVEPAKESEAKAAGADLVGSDELIAEIAQKGTVDFDVAVATPGMMPKIAKLAKLLGPKGLMPNPKTDTVGTNVAKMVQEQKAGKLSFKNDATGNVHAPFGRVSFEPAKLQENLQALLDAVKKLKPSSSKGVYVRNASISSTMGPGVKIDTN